MTDQGRERQHAERNRQQMDMRQQEQRDVGNPQPGSAGDHHGLGGRQDRGEVAGSVGSPQQAWSQNADDIGRQYDDSGFAQGGQDSDQRRQDWSGETRADRQQFQSDHDGDVPDDGSMTREEKLNEGWQDPDDPTQIADEGLIDEDEENAQGGRI